MFFDGFSGRENELTRTTDKRGGGKRLLKRVLGRSCILVCSNHSCGFKRYKNVDTGWVTENSDGLKNIDVLSHVEVYIGRRL